jgi:hypothetical protein
VLLLVARVRYLLRRGTPGVVELVATVDRYLLHRISAGATVLLAVEGRNAFGTREAEGFGSGEGDERQCSEH